MHKKPARFPHKRKWGLAAKLSFPDHLFTHRPPKPTTDDLAPINFSFLSIPFVRLALPSLKLSKCLRKFERAPIEHMRITTFGIHLQAGRQTCKQNKATR